MTEHKINDLLACYDYEKDIGHPTFGVIVDVINKERYCVLWSDENKLFQYDDRAIKSFKNLLEEECRLVK